LVSFMVSPSVIDAILVFARAGDIGRARASARKRMRSLRTGKE
jgi:hypothetical protein